MKSLCEDIIQLNSMGFVIALSVSQNSYGSFFIGSSSNLTFRGIVIALGETQISYNIKREGSSIAVRFT